MPKQKSSFGASDVHEPTEADLGGGVFYDDSRKGRRADPAIALVDAVIRRQNNIAAAEQDSLSVQSQQNQSSCLAEPHSGIPSGGKP